MLRQAVNTSKAPQAIGTYSQAVRAGNLLFISGQIGLDPESRELVKGDIERPSDFDGVVYISLDETDWQMRLGRELQAAGYTIDWNKVMR